MPIIYLVVPCYNEQEVLEITAGVLMDKLSELICSKQIDDNSRILFVDDGSKDSTWQIIEKLHSLNKHIQGLKLSRNKGHQSALLAGLMTAKSHCDAAISLDADLQDDVGAIDGFIQKFKDGCEIVYGVRCSRETDTGFKRSTALMFYKLMNKLGAEVVYNHADYRLMSRRALDALGEFDEANLFLRGIVPLIGFKSAVVEYSRAARAAGKSKYPLKKMLSFAVDGITSFSIKPIRLITVLGIFIFFISMLLLIYFLMLFIAGRTVHGWTTIVISVWAIGGLQLLAIGIIGEYIGKTYLETKHRPKFFIESYLDD